MSVDTPRSPSGTPAAAWCRLERSPQGLRGALSQLQTVARRLQVRLREVDESGATFELDASAAPEWALEAASRGWRGVVVTPDDPRKVLPGVLDPLARALAGAAPPSAVFLDQGAARQTEGWSPLGPVRPASRDVARRLWTHGPAPVDVAPAGSTNLPDRPGGFHGRATELGAVMAAFRDGHQLVVLHGPPGSGRTRIAWRYGATALQTLHAQGGVWSVDLSTSDTLHGAVGQLAAMLGLPPSKPRLQLLNDMGRALGERPPTLLLLSGVGTLVEHAKLAFTGWFRAAPELQILMVADEPVALESAAHVQVQALPPADAMSLFAEHAEARTGQPRDAWSGEGVATLVRQLGCHPARLVEAANWMGTVGPCDVLAQMESGGLTALAGGTWQTIEPVQRRILALLSVFPDGFDPSVATTVLEQVGSVSATEIHRAVEAARATAMLRPHPDRPHQLVIFPHLRAEAEREAELDPARSAVARAHRTWCLARARESVDQLDGEDAPRHLDRLADLVADLDAILAETEDDPDTWVAALCARHAVAIVRNPDAHHQQLLDQGQPIARRASASEAAAFHACRVARHLHDGRPGEALMEASIALAGLGPDTPEEDGVQLRIQRGAALAMAGRHREAFGDLASLGHYLDHLGDPDAGARALAALGSALVDAGLYEESTDHLVNGRAMAAELGLTRTMLLLDIDDAERLRTLGDTAASLERLHAALPWFEACGDSGTVASVQRAIAVVELDVGQTEQARGRLIDALRVHRQRGQAAEAALDELVLAALRREQGARHEAANAVHRAIRATDGATLPTIQARLHAEQGLLAHLERHLGLARECYVTATMHLEDADVPLLRARICGLLAAVDADAGDVTRSRSAIGVAKDLSGDASRVLNAELDLRTIHLHLAAIRKAPDSAPRHDAIIARKLDLVRHPDELGTTPLSRSAALRAAVRLLEEAGLRAP